MPSYTSSHNSSTISAEPVKHAGRIDWLDTLRLLCALQIVGFHWLRACMNNGLGGHLPINLVTAYREPVYGWRGWDYFTIDHLNAYPWRVLNDLTGLGFGFGWEFVNVFILLSGLSIAYSHANKPTVKNWGVWLTARLKRIIIPYYFVALPLVGLVSVCLFFQEGHRAQTSTSLMSKLLSQTPHNQAELWISHLIFLDPFRRHLTARFFSPAWWFIPTILTAYIACPLLLGFERSTSWKRFAAAAYLVTTVSYYLAEGGKLVDNAWYFALLQESFSFCLGLMIGRRLVQPRFRMLLEQVFAQKATLIAGAGAFVVGNFLQFTPPLYPLSSPLCTVGAFVLAGKTALWITSQRWTSKVAATDSYFVYLVHQPLAFPLAFLLARLLGPVTIASGVLMYASVVLIATTFTARVYKALTLAWQHAQLSRNVPADVVLVQQAT